MQYTIEQALNKSHQMLSAELYQIHEKITQSHATYHPMMVETVQKQMIDVREQISHSFQQHANAITTQSRTLTEEIRHHLQTMSHQVNHRLNEGFEKTSSTFIDVVKRLAIIDEAQKKITELSQHVVSLQDVLVDKRARRAFCEH